MNDSPPNNVLEELRKRGLSAGSRRSDQWQWSRIYSPYEEPDDVATHWMAFGVIQTPEGEKDVLVNVAITTQQCLIEVLARISLDKFDCDTPEGI